jgi:hypothetical protein
VKILFSDEFRLAYALLLQAAVLAGAWRFVRRRVATDWADRAADVLLLNFLVQYLAVTLPGVLGILSPLMIAITTLALSAVLYFAPARVVPAAAAVPFTRADDRWVVLACTLFAVAYVATTGWEQRPMPVMANDAVTYHFPAAVRWLQTGRLSLFETWFFNPANTYSPLAGSTFIAWWIAPVGNDVLAHNVQLPAVPLIFFAALRLMRAIGARAGVAAIVGLALVLSQPILRQSIMEKDDLYLTAFFACVVAGCAADRMRDRLGPWRVGVALGLLLATKFTALLAVPALLLLIDAPIRVRWRPWSYAIAAGAALLLAGPWYVRNVVLTGNPIYPVEVRVAGHTVLHGLFATARSPQLSGVGSVWALLTTRDQSLPRAPTIVLLAALTAAFAGRFRRLGSDPLIRMCLLGPLVALAVYLASSPYAEVRFLFPAFVLLFAAAAIAIESWVTKPALQWVAAAVVFVPAWATGFSLSGAHGAVVAELVTSAALITAAGLAVAWLLVHFPARRNEMVGFGSGIAVLILAGLVFVYWKAFIKGCREIAFIPAYQTQYKSVAYDWKFIDTLPPDEPLAYANTFLVHPMSGFDHRRPLLYVPTRRGITHIHDLPPIAGRLSGEQIAPAFAAALTTDTDPDAWLAHLFASGARYLVVYLHGAAPNPPELSIVNAHPERFETLYHDDAAIIYRLRK